MDTKACTTYWKDCSFYETTDDIICCSDNQLIVPIGTFRPWGFSKIINVKSGRCKGHRQEYLINEQKIFLIKGGNNWSISYISTLTEREKNEKEFGQKMLNRAQQANVPWHIAKLTKEIVSDDEAISLLIKIRRIAKNKNVTPEQVYALRSVDLELRLITLKLILGDEIYGILEDVLFENEKTCRLLAYYIAFKGKVKHDLDKKCKIPPPVSIGFFEQVEHNHRIRVILADVPRELVAVTDSIECNEQAVEILKNIKNIAINSELTTEEINALKNESSDVRNSMLQKILNNEIWEKINEQISTNNDLAYFLGYYIKCKGKVNN